MTKIESSVIARDFKRARTYLTLLEQAEADWDAKPNKTKEQKKVQSLIHEAFSLAAVVAYIRPFTKAIRTSSKPVTKPWIDRDKIRPLLKSELLEFHDEMDALRHRTWAHTAEENFKPNEILSIARGRIYVFRNLIDEVERLLVVKDHDKPAAE
jgi:hypothetical protein